MNRNPAAITPNLIGHSEITVAQGRTILVAVLAVFIVHFFWLQVVAEDAYISFRFAKHLAEGHGLVWNVGEAPVEGFTNFLWVLLCAGAIAAGVLIEPFAQGLGLLAAVGTILLAHDWSLRFAGLRPGPALIAPALLAVSGPFATWAGSGMETTLFGFLVTLGCYLFVGYWQTGKAGRLLWCALVFVLASMTRPEGVLVFGVLGALGLLLSFGHRRWRDFVAPAVLFGALFGAYFAWRWSYFGWPLPNTFYAKTGGGAAQLVRGLKHTVWFGLYFVAPLLLVAVPLLFRHRPVLGWSGSVLEAARRHVGAVSLAVVAAVYTLYIVVVGGDYMAMFRFFAPITPLISILAGTLIGALWAPEAGRWPIVGLAAALALILVQSAPLEARIFPAMSNNHGTWRGVQTERWHVNRLRLIGEHFAGLQTAPDESVATGGIGVISYVTNMKVIGLHGLVDVYLAHKEFAPGELGSGLPGHERGDLDYIMGKRPTYYMYNRELTAEAFALKPNQPPPVAAEIIAREYEPVSVLLQDHANGESGYFTYLRRVAH